MKKVVDEDCGRGLQDREMLRTYLTDGRRCGAASPDWSSRLCDNIPSTGTVVAEVEIEEYDVVASDMGVVSPRADRGGTIARIRLSVSASAMRASSAGTACHGVGDGEAFKR